MMSGYGFVYALSNDCMDGVYKVGFSTRSTHQRAEELSASTGVADSFSVAYYLETGFAQEVEHRVHKALDEYRINPGREFFRCPLSLIIAQIRHNTDDRLAEYRSDLAEEALSPGSVDSNVPLWFERSLYRPEDLAVLGGKYLDGRHKGGLFPVNQGGFSWIG